MHGYTEQSKYNLALINITAHKQIVSTWTISETSH